jgi:hypothetical protein
VDGDEESQVAMNSDIEADVKELLGLFDVPAFARRGQELEQSLLRLHARCRSARGSLLDMVRLRLRQWASAVTGPAAWDLVFVQSIEPLWGLAHDEPPRFGQSPATLSRQRAIARDLIGSVLRFNRRWMHFLERLNLDPTNHMIDEYNRYYLLEKELALGSPRLAARQFSPVIKLATQALLDDHPCLPVPQLLD